MNNSVRDFFENKSFILFKEKLGDLKLNEEFKLIFESNEPLIVKFTKDGLFERDGSNQTILISNMVLFPNKFTIKRFPWRPAVRETYWVTDITHNRVYETINTGKKDHTIDLQIKFNLISSTQKKALERLDEIKEKGMIILEDHQPISMNLIKSDFLNKNGVIFPKYTLFDPEKYI